MYTIIKIKCHVHVGSSKNTIFLFMLDIMNLISLYNTRFHTIRPGTKVCNSLTLCLVPENIIWYLVHSLKTAAAFWIHNSYIDNRFLALRTKYAHHKQMRKVMKIYLSLSSYFFGLLIPNCRFVCSVRLHEMSGTSTFRSKQRHN